MNVVAVVAVVRFFVGGSGEGAGRESGGMDLPRARGRGFSFLASCLGLCSVHVRKARCVW